MSLSPTSIIKDSPRAELWFSIACFGACFHLICHIYNHPAPFTGVGWRYGVGGVADRMCPVSFILCPPCSANAGDNGSAWENIIDCEGVEAVVSLVSKECGL